MDNTNRISLWRDGEKLTFGITIAPGLEKSPAFLLHASLPDEPTAMVVHEALDHRLSVFLVAVRRQAYEQGWDDKAAKKRKKMDFTAARLIGNEVGW